MKSFERTQLLERIERDSATVGRSIPETVELGDGSNSDQFPLREFVFETKRQETVPNDQREEVEAVKRQLRRERTQRVERLETESLSYETGEELASSVIGIDRALNALDSLESTSLEAEATATQTADTKRWRTFLRKAMGDEPSSSGGR